MNHLLDSDIVIDLLDEEEIAVNLVRRLINDGVALSVISYMEVAHGLQQKPAPERLRFQEFVSGIIVLPVDLTIAHRCAMVRTLLTDRGQNVRKRSLDLLIAATAIEHDLTLVTRNLADYQDVPGLRIHQ